MNMLDERFREDLGMLRPLVEDYLPTYLDVMFFQHFVLKGELEWKIL